MREREPHKLPEYDDQPQERVARVGKLKLSPTQTETLSRMANDDGRLVRVSGGFWTTKNTPTKKDACLTYPSWSVTINTVRALTRLGLIQLADDGVEEWRRPRELTEAGRKLVF
jgi:hypothetical protein